MDIISFQCPWASEHCTAGTVREYIPEDISLLESTSVSRRPPYLTDVKEQSSYGEI